MSSWPECLRRFVLWSVELLFLLTQPTACPLLLYAGYFLMVDIKCCQYCRKNVMQQISKQIVSYLKQVISVLADRYFYGRWTSSVVNLVFYNVFSGEGSTLYGVEGFSFYFLNAFNNFNFSFLLALLSPSLLYIARLDYYSLPRKPNRGYDRLVVAISPLFIWLAFMSLQAHKEERFVLLKH